MLHCPILKKKSCCPQFVADEPRIRTGNGGYETISVPSLVSSLCATSNVSILRSNCPLVTLNLPTTTIVAQPFNVIKWQMKFNPVA
jgi:hypothetical protein